MGVLIMILIVGVTIAIHEWGHFMAMVRNGIQVKEFTIGFGPTLFEKKLKSGAFFRIKPIIFGGYAMPTEEGAEALLTATPWVRFKVYVAGMFVNATAAFLVMTVFGYATGRFPVVLLPYVDWAPSFLMPLVVAFAFSYGLWLATPVLIVAMLVKSASAFFATAAGPIGIVNMGQQMAEQAPDAAAVVVSMTLMFAMINSAIAGFNLVPLAQLDGGKITEIFLEKWCGRHTDAVLKWYRILSLVLLLSLIVFLFGSDIVNLISGKSYIPSG